MALSIRASAERAPSVQRIALPRSYWAVVAAATVLRLQGIVSRELAATERASCTMVIEPTSDGAATWRYRLPPDASVGGPEPCQGGGQFWIVLSGSLMVDGAAFLPPNSCVFVAPDDGALTVMAGNGGAEALCLQFPVLARH